MIQKLLAIALMIAVQGASQVFPAFDVASVKRAALLGNELDK